MGMQDIEKRSNKENEDRVIMELDEFKKLMSQMLAEKKSTKEQFAEWMQQTGKLDRINAKYPEIVEEPEQDELRKQFKEWAKTVLNDE